MKPHAQLWMKQIHNLISKKNTQTIYVTIPRVVLKIVVYRWYANHMKSNSTIHCSSRWKTSSVNALIITLKIGCKCKRKRQLCNLNPRPLNSPKDAKHHFCKLLFTSGVCEWFSLCILIFLKKKKKKIKTKSYRDQLSAICMDLKLVSISCVQR